MVASLVSSAAERVRRERLTVLPHEDVHTFELVEDTLLVPGFGCLSRDLFDAAMIGGGESPHIIAYLDSILEFAYVGQEPSGVGSVEALRTAGSYRSTETEILRRYPPSSSRRLSYKRGLELVCEACDELEKQVASRRHREAMKARMNGN
jgi:hypothetical protein